MLDSRATGLSIENTDKGSSTYYSDSSTSSETDYKTDSRSHR